VFSIGSKEGGYDLGGFVRGGLASNRLVNCREYGPRCGGGGGDGGDVKTGCGRLIEPDQLVRRAWNVVYHAECLRCVVCRSRPETGDRMYALHDGISLACQHDFIRIAGLRK